MRELVPDPCSICCCSALCTSRLPEPVHPQRCRDVTTSAPRRARDAIGRPWPALAGNGCLRSTRSAARDLGRRDTQSTLWESAPMRKGRCYTRRDEVRGESCVRPSLNASDTTEHSPRRERRALRVVSRLGNKFPPQVTAVKAEPCEAVTARAPRKRGDKVAAAEPRDISIFLRPPPTSTSTSRYYNKAYTVTSRGREHPSDVPTVCSRVYACTGPRRGGAVRSSPPLPVPVLAPTRKGRAVL